MNKDNRILWSSLKVGRASVRVTPQTPRPKPGSVFRVKNMIDLGNGKKTAVLETVSFPEYEMQKRGQSTLSIPKGVANLNLVCTSSQSYAIANVYEAMRSVFTARDFGEIVPDVVVPGDFLVFRHHAENRAKLSHALRLLKQA